MPDAIQLAAPLVAGLLLTVIVASWVGARAFTRLRDGKPQAVTTQVDPYTLAYAVGGAPRAVTVGLVALSEQDLLTARSAGNITPSSPEVPPSATATAFEKALYDQLVTTPQAENLAQKGALADHFKALDQAVIADQLHTPQRGKLNALALASPCLVAAFVAVGLAALAKIVWVFLLFSLIAGFGLVAARLGYRQVCRASGRRSLVDVQASRTVLAGGGSVPQWFALLGADGVGRKKVRNPDVVTAITAAEKPSTAEGLTAGEPLSLSAGRMNQILSKDTTIS